MSSNDLNKMSRRRRRSKFLDTDSLKTHKCTLQQEPDIISTYIYRGNYIALRRRLRRWLTIDEQHPMSRKVFKSHSAISAEKAKHLYHYYYMIHPFSKFKAWWEYAMILVFFLEFIITPFIVSVVMYLTIPIVLKHILDTICWIDIIMRFFTGYYDQVEQRVNLKFTRVLCRYLMTFFIIDFVSTFPWIIILVNYDQLFKWLVVRLLMLLKCVRLLTFLKYLTKLCESKGLASHKVKRIKLVILFMMYVYWASTFLILLTNLHDDTWMPTNYRNYPAYALLRNIFMTLLPMFSIGYGEVPTNDQIRLLFHIACMFLGMIFQMYILAEVLTIRNKTAISTDKYSHLMQQLSEFMEYKELPLNLRQRIHVYFEFRYQKRVYKEGDLLGTLSPLLVKEILLQQCQKLINKVALFRNLPQEVTYRLVKNLKAEIFLPNDIIVKANTPGQYMYFIFTGTVAVYTSNGKEICHLSDGAHFGEISLVMNVVRTAYVVAVDACELFRLSRKDYQEAVDPYPEISANIYKVAEERLADTTKILQATDTEEREEQATSAMSLH